MTTQDLHQPPHRQGPSAGHDHSHEINEELAGSGLERLGGPVPRVGIGGPVGSGKTTLIEALVPRLVQGGHRPVVVTNDIFTEEDARHVRTTLSGVLETEKVVGVETGSCPHTAVRDDPTMNLDAVQQLTDRFPDTDVVLLESGGDNLTLTYSRALADFFVFVIDVGEGDKIPRKRGPGITSSDLLVINKVDIAPYVRSDLSVMERDARAVRGDKPFVFTNCFSGEGLDTVLEHLRAAGVLTRPAPVSPSC
ncbi:MAG TPA: urease accessory protein UreG [Segeticoccus sp.]|uniref:urease accessory protein UreG n=1 Tax=Segeticoccus sp. TaxID=2706531 RepID=UPI002D7F4A1C|nr:urease accessory protein UreG [Segeticoccus sp.]HET8601605.1 urease accessory protein UreG [Segeticoccus sp.]